jgi:hypothetical protein
MKRASIAIRRFLLAPAARKSVTRRLIRGSIRASARRAKQWPLLSAFSVPRSALGEICLSRRASHWILNGSEISDSDHEDLYETVDHHVASVIDYRAVIDRCALIVEDYDR